MKIDYLLFAISILIVIALFLTMSNNAIAESERFYQDKLCEGIGKTEVVLSDRTRVDCMTFGMVIEVDFGRKWAESIGQSIHYSIMTGKQPGIALILASAKDCKYLARLKNIIAIVTPKISLWEIGEYAGKCG